MWFEEYRVDGLRLDAVHAMDDSSDPHIVAEITGAAERRGGYIIAEDERNDARIITGVSTGGWGAHGVWADDFHHTVRVTLTDERQGYFANFTGGVREIVKTLRHGWLYHGQFYSSWRRERGSFGRHLPPEQFVFCISNHDQVGNRLSGDRLHHVVSPRAYRAASMLLCFVPYTPMLFMGQEWAASSPFPFFTDHDGEVGTNMAQNRLDEFREIDARYDGATLGNMPDPQCPQTFSSAKLKWEERDNAQQQGILALYRDCLTLRAREETFQSAPREQWEVRQCNGSVIAIRWKSSVGDWLLLVSLTPRKAMLREAFVQPHIGHWEVRVSSENAKYVGDTTLRRADRPNDLMSFTGPAALLLRDTEA